MLRFAGWFSCFESLVRTGQFSGEIANWIHRQLSWAIMLTHPILGGFSLFERFSSFKSNGNRSNGNKQSLEIYGSTDLRNEEELSGRMKRSLDECVWRTARGWGWKGDNFESLMPLRTVDQEPKVNECRVVRLIERSSLSFSLASCKGESRVACERQNYQYCSVYLNSLGAGW